MCGLWPLWIPPTRLPGGQKQRVAIAGVVAISSGDEEERKSSVELDMFKGFNLDTESLMTALGKIDGRQVTRLMSELLLEHSNVSFLDTDQSPAVWRPRLLAC